MMVKLKFMSVLACVFLPGVTANAPSIKLANGVEMPLLVFGTPSCKLGDSACVDETQAAVAEALKVGFAGIDTANHYHNQAGCAKAIKAFPNVWVTSKVESCNNSYVRWGHCFNDTRQVFLENLDELGLEKVDLMLLHAPTATAGGSAVYPSNCNCSAPDACAAMQEQWSAMEELYFQNKSRSIGVSNYCAPCLQCLAKTSRVTPHVNQIRLHVGMGANPTGLIAYNRAHDVVPQAYSPLGSGSSLVLDNNVTVALAKEHGVSSAQVALRWLVELNVPMITTTSSTQVPYMLEDLAIFNWTMTSNDMRDLNNTRIGAPDSPTKHMCLA
eukprot:m.92884 g.92884  ORF g.92884 m.92884 type:complete len:328 (-) comp26579_c0_seq2:84-1067(-)